MEKHTKFKTQSNQVNVRDYRGDGQVGRINRILNKANNVESISFKDHMIDTNKESWIDGKKNSFCFDLKRIGVCYTYYQFFIYFLEHLLSIGFEFHWP